MKTHIILSAFALLLFVVHISAEGFFGNIADSIGRTAGKFMDTLSNLAGRGKKSKEDKELRKMVENLIKSQDKEGIFLSNLVGDYYVSIKDGKLTGTQTIENASLFDVDTDVDTYTEDTSIPIKLITWLEGVERVLTFNDVGEDINLEIKTQDFPGRKKSDKVSLHSVIAPKAETFVFEIVSNSRNMCVTMDGASKQYTLASCSHGGNDQQIFKFITYDEAKEEEGNRRGEEAFRIRKYMKDGSREGGYLMVGNKSGVLYNEDKDSNEDL
ncbi:hypothetical protein NEFER03_2023 [Nematocida sp. LUAm3]|nr:hypothetical protein NEFER03_2023 [Nematocida sp. LUAm3]KAI5174497.1 hypothetical protein NEFER02_0618 [Nematocida sp. LUAm2]KAI5179148.1 hypothetical protein NEFER01_2011 [Nematocida sp. LUAm1]